MQINEVSKLNSVTRKRGLDYGNLLRLYAKMQYRMGGKMRSEV